MKPIFALIFYLCFPLALFAADRSPKVDILVRSYYKDKKFLVRNLIATLNLFVNREVFNFGVILDDENIAPSVRGEIITE